jgi:hypothetical protein
MTLQSGMQAAHVKALWTLRSPGEFPTAFCAESTNAQEHLLVLMRLRPSLMQSALVLLAQVCAHHQQLSLLNVQIQEREFWGNNLTIQGLKGQQGRGKTAMDRYSGSGQRHRHICLRASQLACGCGIAGSLSSPLSCRGVLPCSPHADWHEIVLAAVAT